MTLARRQDNSEWPEWLHKAWQKDYDKAGSVRPVHHPDSDGADHLVIKTLEGDHHVSWGDYIIQGVQGELYPCKPDIFEQTYEKVE